MTQAYDDRFLAEDNFYFAFKKLSHYLKQANEWYNPVMLAAYEGDLAGNIYRIRKALEVKTYTPKPLEPLPFPKKNDERGEPRMRQYFQVSIDDQLVWMALVNIIGQKLEDKMPFWNYGNRLYRPVWYEPKDDTGKWERKIGSFSNASVHFYRKWNQSWPLYRRYVSMTVKVMGLNGRFKKEDLDGDRETELFEEEAGKNENHYLNKEFWPEGQLDRLYWAGLDLKRFFPSVNADKVIENIELALVQDNGQPRTDIGLIMSTLRRMLSFPINSSGWSPKDLRSETLFGLKNVHSFTGLPTGLFAAGFLANVAMIDVDRKIQAWIEKNRSIAVFKYVDDHIVLARSFDDLRQFLDFYHSTIIGSGTGVTFQTGKLEPSKALSYSEKGGFTWEDDAEEATILDIQYPEPLMTYTIQKMSDLNDEDYELAEDGDLEKIQSDLEHFLIAEFPDTEMRRDTRMSFAAMKLCQLAKQKKPDFSKMDRTSSKIIESVENVYFSNSNNKKKDCKIAPALLEKLLDRHINSVYHKEMVSIFKGHERTFRLLIKVLRDYPDKLKLWKRAIEFCHISGLDKWAEIMAEIDDCALHVRSKEYVFTYVLIVAEEFLLRSYRTIASPTASFWNRHSAILYIRNLCRPYTRKEVQRRLAVGSAYPFRASTKDFYTVLLDFVVQQPGALVNKLLCIELKDSVVYRKKGFWDGKTWTAHLQRLHPSLSMEEYVWYLLLRLPENRKRIWENNAERLDLNRPLAWSILSLYPGSISKQLFQKIQKNISTNRSVALNISERSNFKGDTGFIYELFVKNSAIRKGYYKKYPVIEKALSSKPKGYIRLNQWFDDLLKTLAGSSRLDPRLSEWTQLEIVRQVATAVMNPGKTKAILNGYSQFYFHPANYLVPRKWSVENGGKKISWEDWKNVIREKSIKLAAKDSLIDDFRYFPIANSWKMTSVAYIFGNRDIRLIMGLSVLLLQMISRSFMWPPTANKSEFVDQLLSTALQVLEEEGTSSDTRILLGAIFSKKDFDMFGYFNSINLGGDVQITRLSDFIDVITSIQKRLEQHHVGLKDREPRQLAYVNIDDLTVQTEKFFDLL